MTIYQDLKPGGVFQWEPEPDPNNWTPPLTKRHRSGNLNLEVQEDGKTAYVSVWLEGGWGWRLDDEPLAEFEIPTKRLDDLAVGLVHLWTALKQAPVGAFQ